MSNAFEKAFPHGLCLLLVAVAASDVSAQEYTFTELVTPEGTHSQAFGISENGAIAGWAAGTGAVVWDTNGIVALGHPGGDFAVEARAVNDAGQVACVGEGNPQAYQSFFWESGTWTPIGALPGLPDSFVEDIDSAGRIVGRSLVVGPGAPDRAFIWEAGVFTELGTLGDSSIAYGINDVGQVVGRSLAELPGGQLGLRGFLWEVGQMTALDPLPGDVATQAFDVNDAGEIVGSSWYHTTQFFTVDQAALWRDGGEEVIDLGVVPAAPGSCSSNPYWHKSIARAINNHGQIVGEAMCITSGAPKAAFVWQDGVMHNLNDLIPPGTGLDLRSARDINDAGQIVGYGINPAGQLRAFLLEPQQPQGDLNGDGVVGVNDFLLLLAVWGPCPDPCPPSCLGDLDADCAVGVTDFLILLANWS
jgi:probable HAF family extracellular repeat protein